MNVHPFRRFLPAAAMLLAPPLLGQAPCGTPHMVGLPHPTGSETTRLAAVAQFGANDIWAVGDSRHTVQGQLNYVPMTLQRDGTAWSHVPAPLTSPAANGALIDEITRRRVGSEAGGFLG